MKACDFVPDFMRIGGVTGWQRAAAIAAAAGIPISTHLYPEMAAHVMRVSETAHWLEWQDWAHPILQQPYAVKDGKLHIPDVPGIGLEWDEKAVAAHLATTFKRPIFLAVESAIATTVVCSEMRERPLAKSEIIAYLKVRHRRAEGGRGDDRRPVEEGMEPSAP